MDFFQNFINRDRFVLILYSFTIYLKSTSSINIRKRSKFLHVKFLQVLPLLFVNILNVKQTTRSARLSLTTLRATVPKESPMPVDDSATPVLQPQRQPNVLPLT